TGHSMTVQVEQVIDEPLEGGVVVNMNNVCRHGVSLSEGEHCLLSFSLSGRRSDASAARRLRGWLWVSSQAARCWPSPGNLAPAGVAVQFLLLDVLQRPLPRLPVQTELPPDFRVAPALPPQVEDPGQEGGGTSQQAPVAARFTLEL